MKAPPAALVPALCRARVELRVGGVSLRHGPIRSRSVQSVEIPVGTGEINNWSRRFAAPRQICSGASARRMTTSEAEDCRSAG